MVHVVVSGRHHIGLWRQMSIVVKLSATWVHVSAQKPQITPPTELESEVDVSFIFNTCHGRHSSTHSVQQTLWLGDFWSTCVYPYSLLGCHSQEIILDHPRPMTTLRAFGYIGDGWLFYLLLLHIYPGSPSCCMSNAIVGTGFGSTWILIKESDGWTGEVARDDSGHNTRRLNEF